VFGAFNYTEYNPQKDWTGFPYRLFALPVRSFVLAAVPTILGVLTVEAVFAAWVGLGIAPAESAFGWWLAVLIGVSMIFYQTVLWVLAGHRTLRILALALIGTGFVGVGCLPHLNRIEPSPWLSIPVLSGLALALGLLAFLTGWLGVARQRSGGGARRNAIQACFHRAVDRLPRRRREFRSPAEAQFWAEWRRGGWLLPACVGAVLVVVIAPLSWALRHHSINTVWILGWTLLLPVLLAVPVGKGFSKPDVWSQSLSLPVWMAIRPLAAGDFVVAKLKVAALSAAIAWLLVTLFLALWLPLWANLDAFGMVRVGYWMAFSHSTLPQYGMAAAGLFAGALLTWRGLVDGLWLGLSGRRDWFVGSAVTVGVVVVLTLLGLALLLEHDEAVRSWYRAMANAPITLLEWLAALAIVGRVWLAARTWRRVSPSRVRTYLALWLGGSAVLAGGAMLLWAGGALGLYLMSAADLLPLDLERLRNLLLLLVLLIIPLARLGIAPTSLARNRHG